MPIRIRWRLTPSDWKLRTTLTNKGLVGSGPLTGTDFSTRARQGPAFRWPLLFFELLPDPAGIGPYHFLSGFAVEGLAEFRHVRDHVVDAIERHGVRIGGYDQASDLRTDVGAPRICVREEKALAVGPSVLAFIVER